MLKEAGVVTPLDIDLWYMPVQRPYNPNAKRIGEMMQADLLKIGVNAKLVTYEWGEYRKRAQQGEPMTAQMGWSGDNGDPDNFFFLRGCSGARPGGQNITKWCNKDFDAMLEEARRTTDVKVRAELYRKMQILEKEEAPDLPIAHSVVYDAERGEVEGYKLSPLGGHVFYGVSLK
jgi:dipeptide transport system substrate-binding protein